MVEVVSRGVSHLCDNSTVSVNSGVGSGTVGKARAVPLFQERNYQPRTYRAAMYQARVV